MKHASSHVFLLVRLIALALGLQLSLAHADDYADVAQLMRAGKLPDALARAEQSLAAHPKDAQMRFYKGVIQRDSGKTNDAISTFARLTEDYPELPEPFNNLAVLYAGQGQFDKARAALEQAIRTNPSYSIAHENLGDVYSKLASQAYSRALQLDNNTANSSVAPKLSLIRELYRQQHSGTAAAVPGTLPTAAAAPPVVPARTPTAASMPSVASTPAKPPELIAKPTPPAPTAPVASVPAPVAARPVPAPARPAPAAATNTVDSKEAEAAVRAWASAWSARDVKTYLNAYAKDFTPPAGASRASWEDERRKRIAGKNSITVKLSDMSVTVNAGRASVRFRQDYRAGGLVASSRKILELVKSNGRWQIVKESIGN